MAKETVDEAALPQNLSDEQKENAKHAATFPPNTPHSVINQFKEPTEPTKPADPRDTKEKKKKDE